MRHLLGNIHIGTFSELSCGCMKIVISDQIDDDMIVPRNSIDRWFDDSVVTEPIYYATQLSDRILASMSTLLTKALTQSKKVVLFCDEATYVHLYIWWLKNLLVDLTEQRCVDLLKIDQVDRLGSESDRSALNTAYLLDNVLSVFRSSPIHSSVRQLMKHHVHLLPFEWTLTQGLIAEDYRHAFLWIKQEITEALDDAIAEMYQGLYRLYFTSRMGVKLERREGTYHLGSEPTHDLMGLRHPLKGLSLKEALDATPDVHALINDLFHDLLKIGELTLSVNINKLAPSKEVYLLLAETNEQQGVWRFLSAMDTGFSPYDFLPSDRLGVISINLLAWLNQQRLLNQLPRFAWT